MQIPDINLQGQVTNRISEPIINGELPAQTAPSDSKSKSDTVKLSAAAQARLLYHQGNTLFEIAVKLATDVKTVNSYLSPGTAPTTEPPIGSPNGSAKQAAETPPKGDTVKLSAVAKALFKKQQGNPLPNIAAKTGLDTESVNSYPNKTGLSSLTFAA
jgi:hypothetical protein